MDQQTKKNYHGKRVVSSANTKTKISQQKECNYHGKRVASSLNIAGNRINNRQLAEMNSIGDIDLAHDNSEKIKEQHDNETSKNGFWRNYGYLLIICVMLFAIFKGIFSTAYVPTGSMEPNISVHSVLIMWRLPYLMSDPDMVRGDVAVFWDEELEEILVKRVIGLGGESISFSDGNTYINGTEIQEDYLPQQGITQSDKEFKVPEDSLFMMGDNRIRSNDSRALLQPYIPLHAVRGKALVCIPLREITLLKSEKFAGINIYLPLFSRIHTL